MRSWLPDAIYDPSIKQLLEEKHIHCVNGRYILTDKGQRKIIKELQRYDSRMDTLVLLEMWLMEKAGIHMEAGR